MVVLYSGAVQLAQTIAKHLESPLDSYTCRQGDRAFWSSEEILAMEFNFTVATYLDKEMQRLVILVDAISQFIYT